MSETLKPCPICGKQVEVGDFSGQHWFIFCECGLEFAPDGIQTREELIEAWNRRASGWISLVSPPPIDEVVVLLLDDGMIVTGVNAGDDYIATEIGVLPCAGYSSPTHWMPLPSAPEVEE